MKTIEISTATKSLSEYANYFDEGVVVLTLNNKPVAAIVSLKNVDPDSLALSADREFLDIIVQARRDVSSGKTVSLEEMKKEEFQIE